MIHRWKSVVGLVLLSIGTLSPACRCADRKPDQRAGSGSGGVVRPVAPPRALLGYLSLRDPAALVARGRKIVGRLISSAPQLDARQLLQLALRRARLPRELAPAIDPRGTAWMLWLDEELLKERDAAVLVLPLRSRQAFQAALDRHMKRVPGDQRDGLLLYRTANRPSVIRLGLADRVALLPTGPAAYRAAKAFVLASLVHRKPRHDIEVHLLLSHLTRAGEELDRGIERALAKMRLRATRGQIHAGKPVATALQRLVKRAASLLKGAKSVVLDADVTDQGLRAALRIVASKGASELARLIDRRRTASPGREQLPPGTWLLFADRGAVREKGAKRGPSTPLEVAVQSVAAAMGSPRGQRFTAAVRRLRQQLKEGMTIAVHRPPTTGGVTVTVLTEIADEPRQARLAVDRVMSLLSRWLADERRRATGDDRAKQLTGAQRPFRHGGAEGRILEVGLPPGVDPRLSRLLGPRPAFAWAIGRAAAVFVVGKQAELQLTRTCERLAARSRPSSQPSAGALRRALRASQGQDGVIYLSFVDLVRALAGLSIEAVRPFVADMRHQQVAAAPVLRWGANRSRRAYQVELELPVAHFVPFKPFLEALLRQR